MINFDYKIHNINELDTPVLVVYPERVQSNIETAIGMVGDFCYIFMSYIIDFQCISLNHPLIRKTIIPRLCHNNMVCHQNIK